MLGRRDLLLISGTAATLAAVSTARAQTDPFRPLKREVAELLRDDRTFELVLLATDTLRLNLLLLGDGVQEALVASVSALPEYERQRQRAREGLQKLTGTIENSEAPMDELSASLQAGVDRAISVLVEHGVQPGSDFLRKQAVGFWTFLFTLTESGMETAESVRDWLCGSNPFDALCG